MCVLFIDVARGVHPQGGEKCLGVIVSAPTGRYVHRPGRAKRQILEHIFGAGNIWSVGAVKLVLLLCVLRAATKKGRQLFRVKKVHPSESPGYAYALLVTL